MSSKEGPIALESPEELCATLDSELAALYVPEIYVVAGGITSVHKARGNPAIKGLQDITDPDAGTQLPSLRIRGPRGSYLFSHGFFTSILTRSAEGYELLATSRVVDRPYADSALSEEYRFRHAHLSGQTEPARLHPLDTYFAVQLSGTEARTGFINTTGHSQNIDLANLFANRLHTITSRRTMSARLSSLFVSPPYRAVVPYAT